MQLISKMEEYELPFFNVDASSSFSLSFFSASHNRFLSSSTWAWRACVSLFASSLVRISNTCWSVRCIGSLRANCALRFSIRVSCAVENNQQVRQWNRFLPRVDVIIPCSCILYCASICSSNSSGSVFRMWQSSLNCPVITSMRDNAYILNK